MCNACEDVTKTFVTDEDFFVRGQCRAEMKKHVQYEVNIKLTLRGDIEETNCECTVGHSTSAHCKHVIVVLLALRDACAKKEVLIEPACTEKLQSFHRPARKYLGSPMKARQFHRRTPYSMYRTDNEDFVVWYKDYFRNLIIAKGFGNKMIIKKILYPANPYAVYSDHEYSQFNAKTTLLKSLHLLEVDDETVQMIEQKTRNQNANKLWHDLRTVRITASRFHAICNGQLSEEGAEKLALSILYPATINHCKPVAHGQIYEDVAVRWFNNRRGGSLQLKKCGLFICQSHPHIGASPDRIHSELTVLEVKCPYTARNFPINEMTVPYLERDETNELRFKKNHPYYYQVQGQLLVTGRLYCDFIVFTFVDLLEISIGRDEALISDMLVKLTNFYDKYLQPAIFEKYLYRYYGKIFGTSN